MNKAQKLVLRLFGEHGAELEREARSVILTCPECGHEVSWWEAAGVRPVPSEQGATVRMRCDSCGIRTRHTLERRHPPPPAG